MPKGNLYLIPVPISDGPVVENVIPIGVEKAIEPIRFFVVENLRSARRALRKMKFTASFDEEVTFVELNRNSFKEGLLILRKWLESGKTVGLLSEAGCPAIADPGAEAVQIAHQVNARVFPLVGPSSILMTLMGSGLNGQNFAFKGYCPIQDEGFKKFMNSSLQAIKQERQTVLFMDTPYRNEKFLERILKVIPNHLHLCIARDISGPKEYIKTLTIEQWKQESQRPSLHKIPVMFALGVPQSELF